MPRIGLVHLIRKKNGTEPLRRFLASYRERPAGIEHDLVCLFKGFSRSRVPPEYEQSLAHLPHQRLFVSDAGYDISAYFAAAESQRYEFLCFLNSFSVILAADWLLKLYLHAARDGIGIVGSTGSYQSIYSDLFSAESRTPNYSGYKKVLIRLFPFLRLARNKLRRPKYKLLFDPFPNHHIRTNGFMLRRDIMLAIDRPKISSKFDAYLFESGKSGLTRQILAMDRQPLVVGQDGRGYSLNEWHNSNTFWQSDQENLLVADNQTSHYQSGSMETRQFYSDHAWGRQARPASPPADRTIRG